MNSNIKAYKTLKEINKKFDLINSDQVLEHIPNPNEAILSMYNLTKIDGFILGFFPVIKDEKAKEGDRETNVLD